MNPLTKKTSNPTPADWQAERSRTLHRICTRLAGQMQKGKSFRAAAPYFVREWNEKPYRCAPERALKLSLKSLGRIFRQWKRGGRIAAAVDLRYRNSIRLKITPTQLRAFVRILFEPGTRSAWQAYQILLRRRPRRGKEIASYSAFLRRLEPEAFKQVRVCQRAFAAAEFALAKLRLKLEARAIATIPPALPRREFDFDI